MWKKIKPSFRGARASTEVRVARHGNGQAYIYLPPHLCASNRCDIFMSGTKIGIKLFSQGSYSVMHQNASAKSRVIKVPPEAENLIPRHTTAHALPHTVEGGMIVIDTAGLTLRQMAAE